MSIEITIFEPEETIIKKSDKELEYEQVEKESKLSKLDIQTFYELDLDKSAPDSNLLVVLCKYLLKYMIPILEVLPGEPTKEYGINVVDEITTFAFLKKTVGENMLSIPAGVSFSICGFYVPKLIKALDRQYISRLSEEISDYEAITNGQYAYYNRFTSKYAQQKERMTHPDYKSICIFFSSEKDASDKIHKLLDHVSFITKYYDESFNTFLLDAHTAPFLPIISGESLNSILNNKEKIKQKPLDREFVKLGLSLENSYYDADKMTQLENHGLLKLYNLGQFSGVETKIFKEELLAHKKKTLDKAELTRHINESFSKRLFAVERDVIALNRFKKKYLLLDDKQKKVVELAHKKTKNYANKQLGESVKEMQRRFYRIKKYITDIKPDRLKKELAEVHKLYDSQIDKAAKSYELMEGGLCPHTIKCADIVLKNFAKPWLNTTLRDFIKEEYAMATTSGYSCKICGEHILDLDIEWMPASTESFGADIENDLKNTIWKEAIYIIGTYVKFTTPVPIKPLASAISSAIYSIIFSEQAKLRKSRTYTAEFVKDMTNLYISIYIYSVLCSLMLKTPDKLKFGKDKKESSLDSKNEKIIDKKIKKGGKYIRAMERVIGGDIVNIKRKNKKSQYIESNNIIEESKGGKEEREVDSVINVKDIKLYERYILTVAIKLIMLMKSAIISRLQNMNEDIVKQIFLKRAYLWATKYMNPIHVHQTSEFNKSSADISIVFTDPLYNYQRYMISLATNKRIKEEEIHSVLNISEKELIDAAKSGANIWEKSNIVNVSETICKKIENDKKNTENKDAAIHYAKYQQESYKYALEYQKMGLNRLEAVPAHNLVKVYRENAYRDLATLENEVIGDEKIARSYFYFTLECAHKTALWNNFSISKVQPAIYYCKTGNLHKPGTYIFQECKGEKLIGSQHKISRGEAIKWLINNDAVNLKKFAKMKMIDIMCEVCGEYIYEGRGINKDIVKKIEKLNELNAFYDYYASRCPMSELHEMKNNKCAHCGFLLEFATTRELKYYEKFSKKFEQMTGCSLVAANEGIAALVKFNKIRDAALPKEMKHTFSLKNTAKWAEITEKKYNVLVNLGLSESYKFSDILSGKANPSREDNEVNHKICINKIKTYIFDTISKYNTVAAAKNKSDIVAIEMPAEIKKILIKAIENGGLKLTSLDMASFNHINNIATMEMKLRANFLLETLSGIFVELHNNSKSPVVKTIINYLTDHIIECEKLCSLVEKYIVRVRARDDEITTETSETSSEDEKNKTESSEYSMDINDDNLDMEEPMGDD
jgi:hypothetical protein